LGLFLSAPPTVGEAQFTSTHGFLVTPNHPETVLPFSWTEHQGYEPLGPFPNTNIPVGSLMFKFDENKQTNKHCIMLRDESKLLQCDLEARKIMFDLIIGPTVVLHLERPLIGSAEYPERHMVVISWDKTKRHGLLGVDGVSEEKTAPMRQ
jgi:hypothetical protein